MISTTHCDPCLRQDKSSVAGRYCTDCEEQLCEERFRFHSKVKAFQSHHLIDLSSVLSKIPPTSKEYCDIHTQVLLDRYCINHDVVCCRACVPTNHEICSDVIRIGNVFEDRRNSAMGEDSLEHITHVIKELDRLLDDRKRKSNVKSLHEKEEEIKVQISTIKLRFIKQIEDLEKDLISQLQSIKQEQENKINEQIDDLSKLKSHLIEIKIELESVREHGSDKQLDLVLGQIKTNIESAENDVENVTESLKDYDMQFEESQSLNQQSLGSIKIIPLSTIFYRSFNSRQAQEPVDSLNPKLSRAQIRVDPSNPKLSGAQIWVDPSNPKLSGAQIRVDPSNPKVSGAQVTVNPPFTVFKNFKKDGQLKLKSGEEYTLRNMVIVSNKLLLTNYHSKFPKVYIYKDCKEYTTAITCSSAPYGITAIPGTDKAVVTLPVEQSIQFIYTANMTKGDKVKLDVECVGITATKDNIFVGGNAEIYVLDNKGSKNRKVNILSKNINFLHYNANNNHVLCRSNGDLICVKVDGTQVYQYQVSGSAGVAVDSRGDVYVGGYHSNTIERYTSEGVYHETVLSADDGIKYPYGLSFNTDYTKLFVINNNWKTVDIYSCM